MFIVALEGRADARGFFARTFCEREFADAGISMRVVQTNISRNRRKGTLRGMHLQAEPHAEAKVVQCVRGRIYDVAVDLRQESPTYRRWAAIELAEKGEQLLYIPKGCAHGFLTLEDNSDIVYLMDNPFVPHAALGVRWNDPAFGIQWPGQPVEISERDATYLDFAGRVA
jgi:dTDP-4-dehydrorhamnose 3,5-epimerase